MAYRSYTAAEYRKAGINAGPYALEANGQYRTARRKPILGVVMHITAGLTDYTGPDTSAEGTTKYGASMARSASWHVCIDSDGIIPSVRDAYCAWHAGVQDIPNVNDATLGIEQGTGQVDWRKAPKAWVANTLRNVAVWLAPRVVKYKIPLVVVRDRNVMDRAIRAGKPFGFISHGTVAPHNRVDPGLVRRVDTYPWEQLFGYLREEIAVLNGTKPTPTPIPEDDMPTAAEVVKTALSTKVPFTNAVTGKSETATIGQLLGRAGYGYSAIWEGGHLDKRSDAQDRAVAALTGKVAALDDILQGVLKATGATVDPAKLDALINESVDKALADLRVSRTEPPAGQ